jgi:hypothetical protein
LEILSAGEHNLLRRSNSSISRLAGTDASMLESKCRRRQGDPACGGARRWISGGEKWNLVWMMHTLSSAWIQARPLPK